MRFEGRVAITAPSAAVWAVLTDTEMLTRITPGVISSRVVIPDRLFIVLTSLEMGSRSLTAEAEIEWVRVTPPHEIVITARSIWFEQEVSVEMSMQLSGDEEAELLFAAEMPHGTASVIPAPILHNVASRVIRQLFRNLKDALETASAV